MPNTKVSALTAGTTLGGTEAIPAVQSGSSVRITPAQIATYVAGSLTIPSAAVKSDQETATSTSLYVSPGTQALHPSASIVNGRFTVSGTATYSYGVTSIGDTGTGEATVNFSTSWNAATTYSAQVQVEMTASSYAVANDRKAKIFFNTLAAASVELLCIDSTATTNLIKDPNSWHFAAFGKQ